MLQARDRARHALAVLALLALASAACSSPPEPAAPLTPPLSWCTEPSPTSPCRSAAEIEGWFGNPKLEIVGAEEAHIGIQKASVFTLRVPAGRDVPESTVFRAKWRPYWTTNQHTQPRRELAAYAVQRLFLERHDYVVPPAAAYCFGIDTYRQKVDSKAQATFPSTSCVFGFLSYWLENAAPLGDVEWLDSDRGPLDLELFRKNRTYARSVAHLNLLTYLIDHDDSHWNQFLASRDEARPAVFIVDNTMCFDSPFNSTLDEDEDWSRIQVPAFPSTALSTLKGVTEEQVSSLLSLVELALEEQTGQLVPVAPTAPRGDVRAGVRWASPTRLQIGLERAEVEMLSQRLAALRNAAKRGEYTTF